MAKNKETYKQEFIAKAVAKFGDKFDYSKVDYQGARSKVVIICPIHGEFQITPKGHLTSITGCPECSKLISKKTPKLIDGKPRKELREYRIWKALRTRVNNPNLPYAQYYSGKNVQLCSAWEDFETFYRDMGPCPEGYSIDRIDPNQGYNPENCRWADSYTQSQNRGEFNKIFTYNGETKVLKEWARTLGINYSTLYQRVITNKMPFEKAIQTDPYKRLISFEGESHTLKEWCTIKHMEYSVVMTRISKHKWSFEEAISTPKGVRRK